jgi:hypothetical protein
MAGRTATRATPPDRRAEQREKEDTVKLFVGGLAWATDDPSLRAAFEPFGKVVDAVVIKDRETGRSRGFGFVTFADDASGNNALQAMNGAILDGRSIRCDAAVERERGGGGGGGGGGYRSPGPPREDGGGRSFGGGGGGGFGGGGGGGGFGGGGGGGYGGGGGRDRGGGGGGGAGRGRNDRGGGRGGGGGGGEWDSRTGRSRGGGGRRRHENDDFGDEYSGPWARPPRDARRTCRF